MKIQFLNPKITSEDIKSVVRVIKSGWLVLGGETKNFEKKFAEYLGAKAAVATNSCTSSLHLSLILAGVKKGDEVITTPLSYVATSNAILYCGAKPVFVDVEPETGLIDAGKVEEAITKKTKAILPVHLYGQMADMKKLKKIASKYGLKIIEDAAHAIEARRDGIFPGQFGFAACFSFHVAKNITAGQGGVLVTNYNSVASGAQLLRRDGVKNVGPYRLMEALGYKYLMTDFQAIMLLSQLRRIDRQHKKREAIYKNYAKAFKNIDISFPKTMAGVKHACHMFVIWVDPKKRNNIRESLAKTGIETSIHYNPIHLEPYYKKTFGYKKGDFPIAERLGFSTITLPLHLKLTTQEQNYVIKKVTKFVTEK